MGRDDFGDGGAYPECYVAQYLLDICREKVSCALGRNIRHVSYLAFIRLLQGTPSGMAGSHIKDTAMGGE